MKKGIHLLSEIFAHRASLLQSRMLHMSVTVLWDLWIIRRLLRKRGLEHTMEIITHPQKRCPVDSRTLAFEDMVISWWLVAMGNHSLCLYRALVMVKRACRAEWVESIELVIGVRKGRANPIDGHAWVLVNGKEFRTNPDIWSGYHPILRLKQRVGVTH